MHLDKQEQVLLTGSTGFLGTALGAELKRVGFLLRTSSRRSSGDGDHFFAALGEHTDWRPALVGVQVVLHVAGRAHVLKEIELDPLTLFRRVNTAGTLNLARQAAVSGVRRFVFVSSIGVNGEQTFDMPFTASDLPAPASPYAVSKFEAEVGLHEIAKSTGMEIVIVRPPLIYGRGAPGNFGLLARWLSRGVPLPLGAILDNRRSFVALDNLIDFLMTCISHPAAANQTFLVCDGEDLSTTELLRRMSRINSKSPRLLKLSPSLLQWTASFFGKPQIAQRLLGSLQIDMSKTCQVTGWRPPISVDEGLRRALAPFDL